MAPVAPLGRGAGGEGRACGKSVAKKFIDKRFDLFEHLTWPFENVVARNPMGSVSQVLQEIIPPLVAVAATFVHVVLAIDFDA
jgi:2-oxo-4-hydroxy-4-carboxy--5-ureidoimidazoline (OHCU) decarboxylase